MKTVVAISASFAPDYSFLLPIAVRLWKYRIGHSPRAILVGSEEEWLSIEARPDNPYPNGPRAVVEALRAVGAEPTFVPHFGGYSDATIAQCSRTLLAADPWIHDSQWLMPSDADLFPIHAPFYRAHENFAEQNPDLVATSYYSNGDGFESQEETLASYEARLPFQTLPMCHVAMRGKDWRDLYGIQRREGVRDAMARVLDEHFSTYIANFRGSNKALAIWCADQAIMTWRMCRQDWFPNRVLLIPRTGHPPRNRLDRGNKTMWNLPFDASLWVDAHVLKEPEKEENWKLLLPIVEGLLPEHAAWVKAYREQYVHE